MNKNKIFNPFTNLVLDNYEQEIEHAMDSGAIKPLPNSKTLITKYVKMAQDDLAKDTHMNIRISKATMLKLKSKAAKLGLKYQTMVGSILHQYANT